MPTMRRDIHQRRAYALRRMSLAVPAALNIRYK